MANEIKVPGKKIGFFRRSDGHGGWYLDTHSILEKAISGLLIVLCTTAFNSYITLRGVEKEMKRVQEAVSTVGLVVWKHIDPDGKVPCPFDQFGGNRK